MNLFTGNSYLDDITLQQGRDGRRAPPDSGTVFASATMQEDTMQQAIVRTFRHVSAAEQAREELLAALAARQTRH